MKTIITIILLIIVACCHGQLYTGVGAGISISMAKPVAELQIGYKWFKTIIQAGYHAHIDNHNAAVFEAKAGREIYIDQGSSITLLAGYAFHLVSMDKTELNKSSYTATAVYQRYFGTNAAWYTGITRSGEFTFLTAGIKYYFIHSKTNHENK